MKYSVALFLFLFPVSLSAQEPDGVKPGISINGSPCLIQNLIYSCVPRTCDSIVIMAGDSIEFCTYQEIYLNTDTAYWLRWHFVGATNLPDTILNDYPDQVPVCYTPRWDTAGTFNVEVFYNGVLSAYPTSDCYQQGPSRWLVKVVVLPDPNGMEEQHQSNFEIIPNPSDGLFTVQLEEGEWVEELWMYNCNGECVVHGNSSHIDMTGYAAGLYIVRMRTSYRLLSTRMVKE